MRGVRVNWVRSAETCGLFALAVLATATLTGSTPLLPVLLVAAVLTVTISVGVAVQTGSGALTQLAAGAGITASAWLAYVHHAGIWHAAALIMWALGALVYTVAGAIAYAKHLVVLDKAEAEHERARNTAELRRWTDMLAGVGIEGVTATRVVKTRVGHTITYTLPKDGTVKIQTLRDVAERLDISRELQPGSTEFGVGRHAGEVVMQSRERDVLKDAVPYPMDLSPLTINEPFDIGWSEDGSLCLILFREVRLIIIGETGAGKTNLLNVLIAQLSRCVDVIIFGIDIGKSGRLLAPWLRPWINKQTNRPVIDWPATDRAEAERVLASLINLVKARSRAFAGKNAKIEPTAGQPTYVVVIDEAADLFTTDETREYRDKYAEGQPTPRVLSWLATQIVNKGRSEAVDAIIGTQRSVASHVPSNIKSQCAYRIGLGTTTIGEAANLMPDSPIAQKIMAIMRHAGTGVVWRKDKRPHADKFYQLEDPEIIARIAEHVGDHIRPEPNEFDRAALGSDYASRWQRLAPLLAEWSDMADASQQGMFEQIVAQLPDPEAGMRTWQKRAREIVGKHGRVGVRPGVVLRQLDAENITVDRATLQRWLRTQANDGFMENTRHGMWRIKLHDGGQATGTDGR